MTFCCETCPHMPTCADLTEIVFARPEEIAVDFEDFFDAPDEALTLERPVCPVHRIELPVSGECEACL